MQSISIVGCGYTGLRLAARWIGLGAAVRGFATRPESLAQIAATGAAAAALDLDAAADAAPIDCGGHIVYYAVPPAPTGDGDPRLERFLGRVSGTPGRMVYLSTTGVYGDRGGAVVDEDTPAAPRTGRALRRLAAEDFLRGWAAQRGVSW